jgi:hypothetical protein
MPDEERFGEYPVPASGLATNYGNDWTPFEQTPARPVELEPGTVLGFTKRYTEDGPGYSFAALSVARRGWYLTGPKYNGNPLTWDELLDFIGGPTEWSQVGIVVTWAPLTGPR